MTWEPIVDTRTLSCDAERAFASYVEQIGAWWPPAHSADADTLETVIIEPAEDGRVYERHTSGLEYDWGRVTVWVPRVQLAYTSTLAQPGGYASLVTVTFTPAGSGCEMHFEHGGWNDDNAAYRSKFGDWPLILDRFVAVAVAESG